MHKFRAVIAHSSHRTVVRIIVGSLILSSALASSPMSWMRTSLPARQEGELKLISSEMETYERAVVIRKARARVALAKSRALGSLTHKYPEGSGSCDADRDKGRALGGS